MAGPSRHERCDVDPMDGEMQHVVSQAITPFHNIDQRFVLMSDYVEAVPLQSYDPALNDVDDDHGLLRGPTELGPGAHSGPAMLTRPQPLLTSASCDNEASTDVGDRSYPRRSPRLRGTRHAAAEPFYAIRGRRGVQAPRRTSLNVAADPHEEHIQEEPHRGQTAGSGAASTFAAFIGANVAVQVRDRKCIIIITSPRSNVRMLQQIFEVILEHGLDMVSSSAEVLDNGVTVVTLVCQARQNANLRLNSNMHAALQTIVSNSIIDNQQ